MLVTVDGESYQQKATYPGFVRIGQNIVGQSEYLVAVKNESNSAR